MEFPSTPFSNSSSVENSQRKKKMIGKLLKFQTSLMRIHFPVTFGIIYAYPIALSMFVLMQTSTYYLVTNQTSYTKKPVLLWHIVTYLKLHICENIFFLWHIILLDVLKRYSFSKQYI